MVCRAWHAAHFCNLNLTFISYSFLNIRRKVLKTKKLNDEKRAITPRWVVRFLILLTVFELLPKTCNFTICSIFSNSGHVDWCTASPDTILKLDTLVIIQTKFGSDWSSSFRGSVKKLTTTTSDGNSSPRPGELKIGEKHVWHDIYTFTIKVIKFSLL